MAFGVAPPTPVNDNTMPTRSVALAERDTRLLVEEVKRAGIDGNRHGVRQPQVDARREVRDEVWLRRERACKSAVQIRVAFAVDRSRAARLDRAIRVDVDVEVRHDAGAECLDE